jgi:hypothetical protein
MAYGKAKEFYQNELKTIKDGGLYKEERYIHTPQGADVKVEYPEGSFLCQQLLGTLQSS